MNRDYQVCKPKTSEHRRGMKWYSSITQAFEGKGTPDLDCELSAENRVSLQHSVQFYSVFVETGDERYLTLCEDFLKYSLDIKPRPLRRAG